MYIYIYRGFFFVFFFNWNFWILEAGNMSFLTGKIVQLFRNVGLQATKSRLKTLCNFFNKNLKKKLLLLLLLVQTCQRTPAEWCRPPSLSLPVAVWPLYQFLLPLHLFVSTCSSNAHFLLQLRINEPVTNEYFCHDWEFK